LKIFPTENEKIIFIAIITFYFGLLAGLLPDLDSKTLIGSFATLIAAFFGSFFAFRLNSNKELKLKEEADVAKLNRVLINLGIYLNVIGNISKTLDAYQCIDKQAFFMPPIKNYNDNLLFNINEISLILSEEPSLLLNLSLENDGYLLTLESIKIRNEFFINKMQPAMIELNLICQDVSLIELEKKLPVHIYQAAYQAMNAIIENVRGTEKGLMEISEQLRTVCRKKYPSFKFAKFTM